MQLVTVKEIQMLELILQCKDNLRQFSYLIVIISGRLGWTYTLCLSCLSYLLCSEVLNLTFEGQHLTVSSLWYISFCYDVVLVDHKDSRLVRHLPHGRFPA